MVILYASWAVYSETYVYKQEINENWDIEYTVFSYNKEIYTILKRRRWRLKWWVLWSGFVCRRQHTHLDNNMYDCGNASSQFAAKALLPVTIFLRRGEAEENDDDNSFQKEEGSTYVVFCLGVCKTRVSKWVRE